MKARVREIAAELIRIAAARELKSLPAGRAAARAFMTNSAPAFPIRRPRTRKKPSPTPSPIWARAGRWTGWSAAMSVSARPKWRCAPPLSPPWRASRWRWWCRPRLLARQHYRGFAERFAGFPLKVRQLSRFVDAKEARETKAGAGGRHGRYCDRHPCAAGRKHQLQAAGPGDRGRGTAFRRIHKERLKNLKADVHVLTLTATPIPRTLQLALSGVRDLSLITTAADRPAGGAHLRHAFRSPGGARSACCANIIAAARASLSRPASPICARPKLS